MSTTAAVEVPPVAGPSSASPTAATAAAAAAPSSSNDVAAPTPNGEDAEMEDGTGEGEGVPEDASQVLYLNNLNERIKLDVMKQSLTTLFKEYGKVLGVTAHRNIRMRGQAFVTLDTKEGAVKAVSEVKGFPLYGKPMQLSFARTRSDALVAKTTPEEMDQHKEERLKRKKISRRDNPLRRKHLAQKEAAKKAADAALASGEAPSTPSASTPAAAATRRIVQMPDEYLPPNKILFVQNLPDDTTKESLEALFRPYPNLTEVRTIPGRKNIAFVEFGDETSSGAARDALHNTKYGEGEAALKLKITFAKHG